MINIHLSADGTQWVKFSDLVADAGLEEKSARQKCDAAGIAREVITDDRRAKYIRLSDVAAFFRQYSRPTPEQQSAFERILLVGTPVEDADFDPILTGTNMRNAEEMPGSIGRNEAKTFRNFSGKQEKKAGITPGKRWAAFLQNGGQYIGDFYASPLFAYIILTAFLSVQAALHANAAWKLVPDVPWWEVLALVALVQMVVLVGTIHSKLFGDSPTRYWAFLGVFALYDTALNACNFFWQFTPVNLYDPALPWATKVQGITALIIRSALTIGFPVATVFYAWLVKKIRQV